MPRFNIIFEKNNREKADLVSSGERIAHECGFNRIVCEALATRDLSGEPLRSMSLKMICI
ncbi:MAG: hypothetical protein M5U15_12095 [Kiritimatiellae bacterium]|nr:hypothetical protein [Kiritimatiellia bacterium]